MVDAPIPRSRVVSFGVASSEEPEMEELAEAAVLPRSELSLARHRRASHYCLFRFGKDDMGE